MHQQHAGIINQKRQQQKQQHVTHRRFPAELQHAFQCLRQEESDVFMGGFASVSSTILRVIDKDTSFQRYFLSREDQPIMLSQIREKGGQTLNTY